jgi:hypothetical protein
MSDLTTSEVPVERLRSEVAQLEARYDGIFPPGVYAVHEEMKRQLAALHKVLAGQFDACECCGRIQITF